MHSHARARARAHVPACCHGAGTARACVRACMRARLHERLSVCFCMPAQTFQAHIQTRATARTVSAAIFVVATRLPHKPKTKFIAYMYVLDSSFRRAPLDMRCARLVVRSVRACAGSPYVGEQLCHKCLGRTVVPARSRGNSPAHAECLHTHLGVGHPSCPYAQARRCLGQLVARQLPRIT